jgi:hypothetical protein
MKMLRSKENLRTPDVCTGSGCISTEILGMENTHFFFVNIFYYENIKEKTQLVWNKKKKKKKI